jgi:hypothetical protein
MDLHREMIVGVEPLHEQRARSRRCFGTEERSRIGGDQCVQERAVIGSARQLRPEGQLPRLPDRLIAERRW